MIPIGGIILWSGSVVSIPSNWQICDGTNGTPNLKDRFLVGAGDTYAVDETGGTVNHTHVVTDSGHAHDSGGSLSTANAGPGTAWDNASASAQGNADIDVTASDNLPPFLALAYIQRLS